MRNMYYLCGVGTYAVRERYEKDSIDNMGDGRSDRLGIGSIR